MLLNHLTLIPLAGIFVAAIILGVLVYVHQEKR